MTVTVAYIESRDGVISHDSTFRAWDGFRKRGIRCELFEPVQVYEQQLPLSRETLVAGGVPVVEAALKSVGVPIPTADHLPACLEKYRGRKTWHSTWRELRAEFRKAGAPPKRFVKPLRKHKSFPAVALFSASDLPDVDDEIDDQEVLVAEYVLFVSEWRCFVCRGQILDICRYDGEVLRFPDVPIIQSAITDFGQSAPSAYAIDFGILSDGRTVLVEVNDGYSVSPYGLNSIDYSDLLETRWNELTSRER